MPELMSESMPDTTPGPVAGTWLAQLGQRCLHGESFALVVSPAIADMQFESPVGPVARARHYAAIWKAFAGALCGDALTDAQSLLDDLPALTTLMVVQIAYYAFFVLLLSGCGTGRLWSDHPEEIAWRVASYTGGIALLCIIPTAVCFWPSRRTQHPEPAE
jgi:hypothetical protein